MRSGRGGRQQAAGDGGPGSTVVQYGDVPPAADHPQLSPREEPGGLLEEGPRSRRWLTASDPLCARSMFTPLDMKP